MAILIRYEGNDTERAIYLSQRFYQMIHRETREEGSGYGTLREIALLKYKSPVLTVAGEKLARLIEDLKKLRSSTCSGEDEALGFQAVCERAAAAGTGLWVSGDMFPEL